MKKDLLRKILAPLGLVVLSAALRAGDTAIVDGQNAEDVVGQTDGNGAGVFTQGGFYNTQVLKGFDTPQGVAIDTTIHRLFVADNGANPIPIGGEPELGSPKNAKSRLDPTTPPHTRPASGSTTQAT
ncbi:MAG: hypothetical protein IPN19_05275 [Elusimicrobia bacterium]|nr:hypothetical protein [Elusimicrobiota bacterium]